MRAARNPNTLLVLLLFVVAAMGSRLAPYDPLEMNTQTVLAGPSWRHPMGTDQFGRDILTRLIFGTRLALLIGVGATCTAAGVGVPLGLWAGLGGRYADPVIMRGVDTLLAIPPVLLAMALVAILGPGSMNAGVAVAAVGLPQFARIARAGSLAERGMEYAEAARALGANRTRVAFRTILPNILSPIAVQIPIAVSRAIILEASLSFLGLGTQPPTPSWGLMVNESRDYMYAAPSYGIFPGALLALTVLSLNNLSDLVRKARRV
jgi:peptide/nickel transport system permease protein